MTRTTLVAAASRGIGLAVAHRLAGAGFGQAGHAQVSALAAAHAGRFGALACIVARLSWHAAVPSIPLTRPGPWLWRA